MISGFSALADRSFIVGFLLPTILAAVAFLNVFHDVTPFGALWTAVLDTEKFASLTLLLLGIWLVAVLLSMFNIEFYRVLEGYVWPTKRRNGQAAQLKRRRRHRSELKARSLKAARSGKNAALWHDYLKARRQFLADFPPVHMVLPTEFGNVVRACEAYSLQVYGVDCIPAWLRLSAVIPQSFQDTINSARAEVDFFVNLCLLSIALAVLSAACLLISPLFVHLELDAAVVRRAVAVVAGSVAGFAAYRFAIMRAHAWGAIVRSAFDLYLPDLAKQLGYELPRTKKARREFWSDINDMLLDETPVEPARWPAAGGSKR